MRVARPVRRAGRRSPPGESRTGRSGPTPYTHFTRAKQAAFAIVDVVSRKWIATVVTSEESSTQVKLLFADALDAEGLTAGADPGRDHPLLLAMSDNGGPMISNATREFFTALAIDQRLGRPRPGRHHPRGPPARPRTVRLVETARSRGAAVVASDVIERHVVAGGLGSDQADASRQVLASGRRVVPWSARPAPGRPM